MSAKSEKRMRRGVRKEARRQSVQIVNAFLEEAAKWPAWDRVRFAFSFALGRRAAEQVIGRGADRGK